MTEPHIVFYSGFHAGHGGIERSVIQLIAALGTRYRFTVMSRADATFVAEIRALGAAWEDVRVPCAFSPGAIRTLARHLRHDLAADLMHTVDPRGSTVGCPAGKLARLPVVHTYHGSALLYRPRRRIFYALGEAFLAWGFMDAGIFVSEVMRRQYTRRGMVPPWRNSFIPNAVDRDLCEQIRARRDEIRAGLGVSRDTFLWVNVGRLDYQKAQDVLIHAAAELPADVPWRLLIVGDGTLRPQLEAQLTAHHLSEKVTLFGACSHERTLEIVAAADGFVLPSRYELMPLSILEALAMRVPCVVTDTGDSWRISGGGSLPPAALRVPVDDTGVLAESMRRLMRDSGLRARLQAACAARVEPYSIERTAEEVAAIYDHLLARK